jgi:energy-coupling factor transporter ATP-binding protein EcfA2
MSTAETIEAIVPIAVGVHKILKSRRVYERVADFLARKKPTDILVLGASGAGKSSFLRSIQGLDPYIRPEDRTDKKVEVEGKIDKALFRFIDTPGESQHVVKRQEAILSVYNSKSLGIINVVSYGYHEGTIPRSHALKGSKPSEEYLAECRTKEVDYLAGWTSLLTGRKGPALWLVTVVTKADLWWNPDQQAAILKHYRTGDYFQALGEAQGITHSVRSYSSLNQLFYKTAPMSGFYTDDQRIQDADSLIALLLEYSSEQSSD